MRAVRSLVAGLLTAALLLSLPGSAAALSLSDSYAGIGHYMGLRWNEQRCSGWDAHQITHFSFRFSRARTTITVRTSGMAGMEGNKMCGGSNDFIQVKTGWANLTTVAWGRGDSTDPKWTQTYQWNPSWPFVVARALGDFDPLVGAWSRAVVSENGAQKADRCLGYDIVSQSSTGCGQF